MELRRSWIVGLIEAAEKGNRKRQLEAASLAVSNRSNILTIRVEQQHKRAQITDVTISPLSGRVLTGS
jgi:hypothetical protein